MIPRPQQHPLLAAAGIEARTRSRDRLPLGCLLALGLALAVAATSGGAPSSGGREASRTAAPSAKERARAAYGKLPLSFVPNAGQLDRRVQYSAQIGGAGVFFTKREAVYSLRKRHRGLALRLGFLGADPRVAISGQRRGSGRVNYLIGRDPARWQTNLPTYRGLVYRDLWPGVDLRFRGGRGKLEYELVLKPGADVGAVRLAYRGAERLSLDRRGNLRLETALGTLSDSRPVSYQERGGRRVPVESRFLLGPARNAYGFAVGVHDHSRQLVVDPGLLSSTFLGGSSDDYGGEIALDGAGSVYVTGDTSSTDFPTTAGAFDTSFNGGQYRGDAFVTKLNAAGSALAYSTFLGGSTDDFGDGIAVDDAGSAYITGETDSADFPTTPGAFDKTYNGGGGDAFVTKLNAAGSALAYSTFLGGSAYDPGFEIALDAAGSAYVTGYTRSADFPTTAGAFDTSFNGVYDTFVTKLNAAGSALGYSTFLGGGIEESGGGIALDGARSAYVTGNTESADFPTTAGAFDTSFNGVSDTFVTKLNPAGSALGYSTFLGGGSYESGGGIALDGAGSADVTGGTSSTDFPTTGGAFDTSFNGAGDAFVTKLNAAGSALAYSTFIGGGIDESGGGIALDGAGSAYVTGRTGSTDFPMTAGAFDTSFNGGPYGDAFVTKLNAAGSALAYSTFLGGGSSEYGSGIAVDALHTAYVTGQTGSTNFPTTAGAFDTSFNGGFFGDVFVSRLDMRIRPQHPPLPPPPPPPPPPPLPPPPPPPPPQPPPPMSTLALYTLYDQFNNTSAGSTNSQDYEPANDTMGDEAADDFIVPSGRTWSVQGVDVQGAYLSGPGPADSVNIRVYADAAGGLPGTLVARRLGQSFYGGPSFRVSLSPAVTLAPGTYWLSVQAMEAYSPAGGWGWSDRSVQSSSGAAWRTPLGGYATGCTRFARRATTCGLDPGAPDQVFRLRGTTW